MFGELRHEVSNELFVGTSARRAGWSHDWQSGWSHLPGKNQVKVVPFSWQATAAVGGRSSSASRPRRTKPGSTATRSGGYTAWYRHITLSMAAAAFLTILRRDAEKRGCVTGSEADIAAPSPPPEDRHAPLMSFSVNETRRLFNRIVDPVRHPPAHIWRWSLWRRMHQTPARRVV
uniref:Uncharacterized protein n=1 Tax=Rhodococcus sp. NS1 TaxID=402236 RepID=A0A097SQX0_9NOCA|nr:hypothetical protein LRS1606.483 [Rhodococcus sp. NS1]